LLLAILFACGDDEGRDGNGSGGSGGGGGGPPGRGQRRSVQFPSARRVPVVHRRGQRPCSDGRS